MSVYVGYLDNAPDWLPPPGDTAKVELKAYDAAGDQVGGTATTTVTVGQAFVQLTASDPSDQPTIAYFDVTQVYVNSQDHPKPIGIDSIGITRSSTPPPPSFSLDADGNGVDVTHGLGRRRRLDASPRERLERRDRTEHRRHAGRDDLELLGEPADRHRHELDAVADSRRRHRGGLLQRDPDRDPLARGAGSAPIGHDPGAGHRQLHEVPGHELHRGPGQHLHDRAADGTYEVYNAPVEVNGLVLQPLTTTARAAT